MTPFNLVPALHEEMFTLSQILTAEPLDIAPVWALVA
jgi:hypothetical protein